MHLHQSPATPQQPHALPRRSRIPAHISRRHPGREFPDTPQRVHLDVDVPGQHHQIHITPHRRNLRQPEFTVQVAEDTDAHGGGERLLLYDLFKDLVMSRLCVLFVSLTVVAGGVTLPTSEEENQQATSEG